MFDFQSRKQKDLAERLSNSQNKGQCYLQMYESGEQGNHARRLLQFLDQYTLRQIRESLEKKLIVGHNIDECKTFCREFQDLNRDYQKKTNQRNAALFGTVAFGLIGALCMTVFVKTVSYYFSPSQNPQSDKLDLLLGENTPEVEASWISKLIAFAIIGFKLILGSSAFIGFGYSVGLVLCCFESYLRRRKQSRELKNYIQNLLQRHQR